MSNNGKNIICDICGKKYSNIYVLTAHNKIVHEGKNGNHECDICKQKFATKYKLSRHIKGVHSNVREFHCEQCGKSFKTRDVALKHQRVHENDKGPFQCNLCGVEFKFRSGLVYHEKLKHQSSSKKKSIETKNLISNQQQIEQIEYFHNYDSNDDNTDKADNTCHSYEYIIEEINKSDSHQQIEENLEISPGSPKQQEEDFIAKDEEIEVDDDCQLLQQIDERIVIVEKIETTLMLESEEDESQANGKSIEQFMLNNLQYEKIDEESDRDFFDQLIDEESPVDRSYDDDLNFTDYLDEKSEQSTQEIKSHICDLCGSSFKSKSNLKRHVDRKHNKTNHKLSCDICHKKFLLNFDLTRHLISHSEMRNFSCKFCNKKFKTKLSLRNHELVLHSETPREGKSFKCSECNRSYFHKRHLEYHQRKHQKQNPFMCLQCDKSFSYSEALTWHRIRIHNDEAPFSCDECNKKFLYSKSLQTHKIEQHGKSKK